ncbi:MAG: L-2-hydroxyglutarate oxidase [Planctomycetaceae bacterium]|nr:L-2-hydroxyglutarate oxidase [Planctomycetaceae bacterium]
MSRADVAIIGGGIVGLATAYRLGERYPDLKIVVLEKESRLAEHQTGHNSGVLHSGIYYKPGSLRAVNCRDGKFAMMEFCEREGIPIDVCGKVIVATDEAELPQMQKIFDRGQANGVKCEIIDKARLDELEPHTAGIKAIHVPEAGILDYRQVAERMGDRIREQGGRIMLNARVVGCSVKTEEVVIRSTQGDVVADYAITCAGLQADRVTSLTGERPAAKIVPFRGEFFDIRPAAQHLCRNLIYPVPDPNFPFLGVHFTRMIHGGVECGPNAVLAFAREGYHKSDVNLRDLMGALTYGGFIRMAARHWRTGAGEMWRSLSKQAFVRALQRLVPEITADDLSPAPAGVRAMALGPDGQLLDDFVVQQSDRVINVGNAPSPAATASLNIGRLIVENLAERLPTTVHGSVG